MKYAIITNDQTGEVEVIKTLPQKTEVPEGWKLGAIIWVNESKFAGMRFWFKAKLYAIKPEIRKEGDFPQTNNKIEPRAK